MTAALFSTVVPAEAGTQRRPGRTEETSSGSRFRGNDELLTCLETLDAPAREAAPFVSCEFHVRWATTAWEREQSMALRRSVFCVEQGLFDGTDRDPLDDIAQPIVAWSVLAGMPDEVVGTVRIDEREPGVWWGSRLAVDAMFRDHGRIGATLIRLAVCSAHARGCTTFLAHVQRQNVALFERLRWTDLGAVDLFGRDHALMRADLAHYAPCTTPQIGFVTTARAR
jgi:putative N-acetyltransferase (TIGR04045 family)